MADIILPQVAIQSSINSSTNILIEESGEIKRVNASLLNSNGGTASDASTLQGHPASYFATANELSTTITDNDTDHSVYEGYFADIDAGFDEVIAGFDTVEATFADVYQKFNNKDLLYNVPTEDGVGEVSFALTREQLEQYEYLEFSAWTYIEDVSWWYEPIRKIRVDEFLAMMDSEVAFVWFVIFRSDAYMRYIYHENNSFEISGGCWNDDYSNGRDDSVLVIERIWGIKPTTGTSNVANISEADF